MSVERAEVERLVAAHRWDDLVSYLKDEGVSDRAANEFAAVSELSDQGKPLPDEVGAW